LTTELRNSKKEFLSQNKENAQLLEKQIKDQIKQIEDMKEQIYEHENKYTELELQNDDLKNNSNTNEDTLKKQIDRHKQSETDT
jgi:hypothetical protein